ncbi:hypothetical protein [Rathayibacter tritici]|uniref:hypothetical protein n=1 Tax=Rathayibacter tritici TaxID=33888 RepID=UPI001AD8062C|nr:hypothetical protein [Rathayibacter tritici]
MDHREPRRVDNYSTGPGNVGQLKTGYRGRLTELPNLIRTVTRLELYRLGW